MNRLHGRLSADWLHTKKSLELSNVNTYKNSKFIFISQLIFGKHVHIDTCAGFLAIAETGKGTAEDRACAEPLLLAADDDGTVRMVQHVVADGAQDRASDRPQAARPHDDQRHVLVSRDVAQLVPCLTLLLEELVVYLQPATKVHKFLNQSPM